MMSGINQFLKDTLNQAAKASQPTQEVRCAKDYMFSSKAFDFFRTNLRMEPPVYYVPSLYQQLEEFATIVKAWEPPPPPLPLPPSIEKKPPFKVEAPPTRPLEKKSTLKEEFLWTWDGSLSSILKGIFILEMNKFHV